MSRVLIVGGNDEVRELIGRALQSVGHRVVSVGCSLEGVKLLGTAVPRYELLIVNSMFLKDLDLSTFLRCIRPLVEDQTPVILTTAAPREVVREDLPRDGARLFAVLPKPFDLADLLALVRRALLAQRIRLLEKQLPADEPAKEGPPLTVQEVLNWHANVRTETALGFLDVLEGRAPGLRDHGIRVHKLVRRVGVAVGLDEPGLQAVSDGGLLHDIGKCVLPDRLFDASRPLGPADRLLLLGHGAEGAALIRGISLFAGAEDVIHHHHERYDGRGYPQGLGGTDIPYGARICAIADLFDNVCEGSGGRLPRGRQAGFEAIQAQAGRAMDPALVATFQQVVQEDIPGADP